MTVKGLKKRLKYIDDDQIVVISDGKGWCNIEKIISAGGVLYIVKDTKPIFLNKNH